MARLGFGSSGEGQRPGWGAAGRRWLALGALAFSSLAGALAQGTQSTGTPAPSSNTGGQTPGQAGTTATTPAAVPQASQAVRPGAAGQGENAVSSADIVAAASRPLATTVWQLRGLRVEKIEFEGVTFGANDSLPQELAQQAGQALDPAKVRESMRRLFASGRYRDIDLRAVKSGDSVTLIFVGTARYYVGRVVVEGIKVDRLTSLAEYGTKLDPGTAITDAQVTAGIDGIKQVLAQNGYYQPTVTVKTSLDAAEQQVNATYTVALGPQARVGQVLVDGKDAGLTEAQFRKKAKLKRRSKVTRDTTSNALTQLRAQYQKKDRLEATVTMQKQTYDAPRKELDYQFAANQGPVVKVLTEGVRFSKSRLHLLVPIFEEGTIDNDLLNEGTHNIREYLVQQGYFDATVEVRVIGEDTPSERVVYIVVKEKKHKVKDVVLKGNKYFDTDTLKEKMRVQKADAYLRNGRYSPGVMRADEDSIKALYRANGFTQTKITADVRDIDEANGKPLKVAEIRVTLTIEEGPQQKFGAVDLAGVDAARAADVKALLNAQSGQPFSLITLSGDRDEVLGYYLSHGFDQAKVEIKQQQEKDDATKTDVTLNVTEGQKVSIDKVLLSGIRHTKPRIVQQEVKVHPGDPLDQSALLDTQRNLYNLALFNEVVAAVQNPTGNATEKNVLVQVTEAKRWDVTYGFGFEAQTGTPTKGMINPASAILLGIPTNAAYSQNGKTGVSPRVSVDVSRINLRGTDESLTLHGTYGLLEEVATLSFANPHLRGSKSLSFGASGGYSNVQNISTFAAKTLQSDVRVTQKYKRTDTFIYDFQYRRVQVDPGSLQVSANLIPLLSQPVRVGGPGLTWFHDKRTPTPLDAFKGSYTSVQEFLASSKFGSQTSFNRVDVTNSTYYTFGKRKYVFARNTRFGFENVFGANPNAAIQQCTGVLLTTNASCDAVPLPERLYSGGATSHRGFPINGAGPRDLQTGFPVGGTAALVNTIELRLPSPTLPIVGDSVGFVVFHDAGNVFQNASDLFPSIGRFHQPNQQTCYDVTSANVQTTKTGTCNFNYFSHAIGLGARYKTPVGPIRADVSYNINPPVYPVLYDFNGNPPHSAQASHINFFFSIGQSF